MLWDCIYKLHYTNFNIVNTYIPVSSLQGTVISLDNNIYQTSDSFILNHSYLNENKLGVFQPFNTLLTSNLIIINGNKNTTPAFAGVFQPKFNNSIKILIDGSQQNIPILELIADAGIIIDNISVNVLIPFTQDSASSIIVPQLTIGTDTTPDLLVHYFTPAEYISNIEVNPIATQPDLSTGSLLNVDFFNDNIVLSESDDVVNWNTPSAYVSIQVVRSGGIFQTPSPIVYVSNPGSGYSIAPSVYAYDNQNKLTLPISLYATLVNGLISTITMASFSGCAYNSNDTHISIVPSLGSASAQLLTYPANPFETSCVWQYQSYSSSLSEWILGGTITFSSPNADYAVTGSLIPSCWLSNIKLPVPYIITDNITYLIQLVTAYNYDITGATISPSLAISYGTDICTVVVSNTIVDPYSVDLTTPSSYVSYLNANNGFTVTSSYTGATLNIYLSSNISGLATAIIDYHYTQGFEVFNLDNSPFITTSNGNGGNLFTWFNTRYSNFTSVIENNYLSIDTVQPASGWAAGDIVEIDNDNNPNNDNTNLWGVYRYNGYDWLPIEGNFILDINQLDENILGIDTNNLDLSLQYGRFRKQNSKIISSELVNAQIYNTETNILEQTLQIYDPYKGFILGAVEVELAYKLNYDPAMYNTSNSTSIILNAQNAWGKEQVHKLWWNLSTTKYLDYEIDDIEYRWKYWGQLAPGISVDIYQWVRSPVSPLLWNNYSSMGVSSVGFDTPSGFVVNANSIGWVENIEWFSSINTYQTVYYFWVKGANITPNVPWRNLSAIQVTSIIQDPIGNGYPYFIAVSNVLKTLNF